MADIVEDPHGVAIYRRVVVGHIGRGPTGRALCINCGTRERGGGGHATLFCGAACRREHRARPPKARWQPCPVCGEPCTKCRRALECRAVWQWFGRTPVRTGDAHAAAWRVRSMIDTDDIRVRIVALARAAGIDGELDVRRWGQWENGISGTVRVTIGPLRCTTGRSASPEAGEAFALVRVYHQARLAAQRAALWSVVHGAARAVEKHRDRATELRERAVRLRAEAEAAEREAALHESALVVATAHEDAVLAGLTDAQRAALDVVRADAEKGMP